IVTRCFRVPRAALSTSCGSKFFRDKKLKKVQAQIQGDTVRILSPSRDELQNVMQLLKSEDFGVELQFGNFRSA
ncbi:MAG: DUF520 family protein, partial [Myxococcota bacterium]